MKALPKHALHRRQFFVTFIRVSRDYASNNALKDNLGWFFCYLVLGFLYEVFCQAQLWIWSCSTTCL